MRCPIRVVATIALASGVVLAASPRALAQPSVAFLAQQLKGDDDYRVRTQAALALGATGDEAAVAPLCEGLGDSNVSVRAAAAAALGKLGKPSGLPCLQAAEKKETAPSVKSQIQKSATALESGGGGSGAAPAAPPPPGKDAKYYVAIEVTNRTGRPNAEIEALVRSVLQTRLLAKPGVAVAPAGETPARGGQIVKSRRLKGFLLLAAIEAPVYDKGSLVQVVRLSTWTYPGKALQSEISQKLTQTETPTKDVKSENELVKAGLEEAVEKFYRVAPTL